MKKHKLPSGYSFVRKDSTVMILADKHREQLLGAGIEDPQAMVDNSADAVKLSGGRGMTYSIPLDVQKGGIRLIIRHYEHGGVFRKVFGDIFIGCSRPLNELAVNCRAIEMGLPVPGAIAVCIKKYFGVFTRNWFISREITMAVNAADWLVGADNMPGVASVGKRKSMFSAVSDAVRNMHDKGLYHNDLNLNNILFRESDSGFEVFLIDLDKTRIKTPMRINRRMKNLLRLNRSVEKLASGNVLVKGREKLRFLKRYFTNTANRVDRRFIVKCLKSER